MALFRSPPRQTSDEAEAYDLATPEEVARRRRRRRLGIGLVFLMLAGGGVWLGGYPAYRAVRDWQARRTAGEALRAMDAGRWDDAMGKVRDSLALSRVEPEVMRTAAVFLTRAGRGREAIGFWKELEKRRRLTMADERDYCGDLLAVDEIEAAQAKLRTVWPEGTEGTPADWRLALQLALRRRQSTEAIHLAGRLIQAPDSNEQQRFDAAQVLIASSDAAMQKTGWDTVQKVARGRGALSLQALLMLARQEAVTAAEAQKNKSLPDQRAATEELAVRIENHPLAKTAQKLLADDLRLTAAPERRAELIKTAVERYEHGDDEALTGLTAWLYSQREFQRVLDVLPPTRATATKALYLQFLDTLGALGRWQDIKNAIEAQRFTLDPVLEQMYLARCLGQLGQVEGSTLRWNAAVQAAGADVDKLLSVGQYAERNGVAAPAEAAFRAAWRAAPNAHGAPEALLGLLETQGRTADARGVLSEMLKAWPNDPSVRNDLAYLNLLLNEDVAASRDVARELVRDTPNNLPPRITLALGELRLGHALTALDTLNKVPLSTLAAESRYLAVSVAVLRAVGSYDKEIAAARQSIDPARLLPEERELIKE